MQDKTDGDALGSRSPLAPASPSASPRAPVSPQTPAVGKSAGGGDPNSNMTPSTEDSPSAHSELARLLRSNSKNHYTTTKRDVSTGPLLRSLELRFQLESELIHVVDKFKNLNSRHTAEEFSRKIHELETLKLNVDTLKEKLSNAEANRAAHMRKIADLEQDKAAQLVQIMKLREKTLTQVVDDHEERAVLLTEKDDEIEALNEHLKSLEKELCDLKATTREYRERCEKAEVQMADAVDSLKTLEASTTVYKEKKEAEIKKLESRVKDGDEYRSTVNSRLGLMEDEVSSLNSTILKLKADLTRATSDLEQERKKSADQMERLQEADTTMSAFYESSKEERSSGLKTKEEMDDMKRELAKLKSRDKGRYNEGALKVAQIENERLRSSLAQGQKQIDELEAQNIALMRKLADQENLVERTKAEMVTVQSDAQLRVERLENNIRVLCQNIESSNSILSMRSRKNDEQSKPKQAESKADMVRREMEQWQAAHKEQEDEAALQRDLAILNGTLDVDDYTEDDNDDMILEKARAGYAGKTQKDPRKSPQAQQQKRVPGSPYTSNAVITNKSKKQKGGGNAVRSGGRSTFHEEIPSVAAKVKSRR